MIMKTKKYVSRTDAGAALKAAYDRKVKLIERIREGATASELEQEGFRMVRFA